MIPLLVVVLAMTVVTWLAGWWGVVLVALVAGYAYRDERGSAWRIALAALVAWALLLALDALMGPFGRMSTVLASAVSIPVAAIALATLLLPALLAWSAATVAAELGRLAPHR
jgi:hypothetical protein